jgi:hypothetical protein
VHAHRPGGLALWVGHVQATIIISAAARGHCVIPHSGHNRRTTNYLKAMYFDYPESMPCVARLMNATWMKCREALEDLFLSHPRIFPAFPRGSRDFDRIDSAL